VLDLSGAVMPRRPHVYVRELGTPHKETLHVKSFYDNVAMQVRARAHLIYSRLPARTGGSNRPARIERLKRGTRFARTTLIYSRSSE